MISTIYQSVQEFINAYSLWRKKSNEDADREKECDMYLYSYWLCCPKHIDLLVEFEVFQTWAKYYDTCYDLHAGYEEQDSQYGFPPKLSRNWFERVAKCSESLLPEDMF